MSIQTENESKNELLKAGKKVGYKGLVYDPNKPKNVADHYKHLTTEEIIQSLESKRGNYSILLLNIEYDNNVGSIIRTANAFGAKEIILYGRKKFDRRASVGVEFYMNFRQLSHFNEIDPILSEFDHIIALENNINFKTTPISKFVWEKDKKTLICIGQEGSGLPIEILEKCNGFVEITQKGSVRSLNVSAAAAIVMYDYCLKTDSL